MEEGGWKGGRRQGVRREERKRNAKRKEGAKGRAQSKELKQVGGRGGEDGRKRRACCAQDFLYWLTESWRSSCSSRCATCDSQFSARGGWEEEGEENKSRPALRMPWRSSQPAAFQRASPAAAKEVRERRGSGSATCCMALACLRSSSTTCFSNDESRSCMGEGKERRFSEHDEGRGGVP